MKFHDWLEKRDGKLYQELDIVGFLTNPKARKGYADAVKERWKANKAILRGLPAGLGAGLVASMAGMPALAGPLGLLAMRAVAGSVVDDA